MLAVVVAMVGGVVLASFLDVVMVDCHLWQGNNHMLRQAPKHVLAAQSPPN